MLSLDALDIPRHRLSIHAPMIRNVDGGMRVLDESRSALPLGGSKVRSLEWLLGAALQGGGDVITLGPAGGQHLLSSAVYGRRAGLRVHAVAWPCFRSVAAESSLRALHAHAEMVWPTLGKEMAIFTCLRVFSTVRFLAGYAPTVWPPGGSSAVGTLGWVEAGLQVANAVRDGGLHQVERVYVPLGSGGLAVGLQAGLALGGSLAEVVAVDVTGVGRWAVPLLQARLATLLATHGVTLPKRKIRCVAERSAYGVPTQTSVAAEQRAKAWGIGVDPTYGAKALAVALADTSPQSCLFVATANGQALEPLLAAALPTVPNRLAALLR